MTPDDQPTVERHLAHDHDAHFVAMIDRFDRLAPAQGRGGRLRWLSLVATLSLLVGLVVPLLWARVNDSGGAETGVNSSASASQPQPVASGSLPTTQRRVPVYYLGADGLLYREFRDLPTQGDRLTTAVAAVLNVAAVDPAYHSGWSGGQVNSATLQGDRIVLNLSASAFGGWTDQSSAMRAVDQVVYTAIAAVGDRDGTKTVQVLIDGSPDLPVLGRPSADFVRDGLTPMGDLWVTIPEPGQKLPSGTVTLSGYQQITVADPTVGYKIFVDGSTAAVKSGTVTAVGNESGWRVWQLRLQLDPGDYRLELASAGGSGPVVKSFSIVD